MQPRLFVGVQAVIVAKLFGRFGSRWEVVGGVLDVLRRLFDAGVMMVST